MSEQSGSIRRSVPPGTIEVMPSAIATIAVHAATQTAGVIGMARPNVSDAHTTLLSQRVARQGVEVQVQGAHTNVDVYVVLAYGARIVDIAQAAQANVQRALEHALGTAAVRVRVRVQGLEMPKNER